MDDDKINPPKNQSQTPLDQPQPIFETAPVDAPTDLNLQPEEVGSEVVTPEEATTAAPPSFEVPPEEPPMMITENRNKFFIIGAGIGIFVLIFIVVLGLFFGGKGPEKKVTLLYWGLWEEKSSLDPLIQEYQSKNPNVKIDYQKMTPQDYREKLIVRSKNGQGPDIFRFHNTWLPQIREIAAPILEKVMTTQEFEQTFYPIHAKDLRPEGENFFYGIPLMIDGLVLVYNDSLFKKANLTRAPATWDDVIKDAVSLTVKDQDGKIITSGIALGTASNIEHFPELFGLFLSLNGADIKDLAQEEAAGALQQYRQYAEAELPDHVWNETLPEAVTAFVREQVAMIIVPSWEILTIKSLNPDISLKVAPIPQVPGNPRISLATYWVEGVSKLSKNQEEAWKFLKFLAQKESLEKLYSQQSKTRPFGEPYPRRDMADLLKDNEFIGPVIAQADGKDLQSQSYKTLPTVARTYDGGLNKDTSICVENAINSTIQGVAYEEALRVAKQCVDQVLARFNIITTE